MSEPLENQDEALAAKEHFLSLIRKIARLDDPVDLMDTASATLNLLLRRDDDQSLYDRHSESIGAVIGGLPFESPEAELRTLTRQAGRRCLQILQIAREKRPPREGEDIYSNEFPGHALLMEAFGNADYEEILAHEGGETTERPDDDDEDENKDIEYYLPQPLAHLLGHIQYETPQPATTSQKFDNFDEWYCAAIIGRVNRVLAFFQRNNPEIKHELPPPFLLSPQFAEHLSVAIRQLIFPALRNSRQLRLLSTTVSYAHDETESFWSSSNDQMKGTLSMMWSNAWDSLKPIEVVHKDGEKVHQVKDATKELRTILHPASPEDYDIPRIGDGEIEIFKSLLDPNIDRWEQLNLLWSDIHLHYEQEMDPRVFQQQAREGALRDNILSALPQIPEQWGDFILLLCHRVFSRFNTTYLERFVRNIGADTAAQIARMPYLMRYLQHAHQHPEIKRRERADEAAWREQGEDLKKYLKGRADLPPPPTPPSARR